MVERRDLREEPRPRRRPRAPRGSRPSALALALLIVAAAGGCPRATPPTTSVSSAPAPPQRAPQVVFNVVEKGSGIPLQAYVWARGHQGDFEVVRGTSGAVFQGLGRTGDGYVVPFVAQQELTLMVWAPQHEVSILDVVFAPGLNTVDVDLRRTEVADERVPMEIWISVMENLLLQPSPTEEPRTGK